MKKLLAVLLALPAMGCSYAWNRVADFSDILRVEGSIGVGIQADVTATELGHVGLGSSRRLAGGWRYGEATGEKRVEDHFPLSYVWTITTPDTESLHSLRWGDEMRSQHRCYMIVPGGLGNSTWEKDPIHYWDVEAGVFAAILGVQIGFSPGELLDWLLGWFGADIAGDDGELRAAKSYWIPAEPKPGK